MKTNFHIIQMALHDLQELIKMNKYDYINPDDFREWVDKADNSVLEAFIDEIHDFIIDLEQDDFFGTEGLNKRFA